LTAFDGGEGSKQSPDKITQVGKTDEAGNLSGWIEALGVDSSYQPPPERAAKPVACFYIVRRSSTEPQARDYHRAIYLMQRTLKEFTGRISAKWGIDASKVRRTVHVLERGLEVEMDDDVIRELKEGQDMALEVSVVGEQASPLKREWEMSLDVSEVDSEGTQSTNQAGYELRLTF
jgi:hypothetical protein